MKVVGFGESEGGFTVIMEQPFVEGSFATNEDIATFIKGRFKDTEEDPSVQGNTSYKNNEYLLQDLKPQNVIVKVTNGEKQFYVIDGDFYDNPSAKDTTSKVSKEVVKKHQGKWSRVEATQNPKVLYVFTDNTDRDSGRGKIPAESWYSKKYGEGHHFPTMTAAVVRGLENSRPLSTQRWYHQGAKGNTGRWTDADVNEFKAVITDELQEIVKEFNTGKYDTIMFPGGDGLFNTSISNISKERTPLLYQTLGELLHDYGFDNLIPVDINLKSNNNNGNVIKYTEPRLKNRFDIPPFTTVKEVTENLGGYFEGGGANIFHDFPNATEADVNRLNGYYMGGEEYDLTDAQVVELGNKILGYNKINSNNNGTEEYKTTDEFRRIQEGSRKFTEKGLSPFNQGVRELDDLSRGRIGGVLERLLDSQRDDSRFSVRTTLTHENKNGKTGSFTLGEVSPKLFHDIFEVTRVYLRNGELVDLHDDYSNCKCFVTSDGLCGFAIEPDGNLVSVFSLSPSTNKGFLYAIKDFVRQEGATHLDAYASSNQPLQKIYAKTLDFHTASTMDYNMEYDHDDIAKNHGNPQVVFMVDHEVAEPKHFDKDSYDEAQQYQLDQLKDSIPKQLISHLKSQGINVKDRAAMEEFLKTHKVEYLQQYINKYRLPKGELSTLSSTLMTKYGNKTAYGDVIQTANYEYTVNYKGAGEFDIIEYHQIDNNLKDKINDKERRRVPGSLDRLSTRDEITKGEHPSDSYNAEDREADGNNARLDKQTSQGEPKQTESNVSGQQHQEWSAIKRDSETGRIIFVNGDGKTISSTKEWNEALKGIPLFTTPQGEVYGFVDKEGNIYLDETKISPEHPIHEYTHLWDRTVKQKNPKLWQRGVELMKQTSLWNEILNDEHYGKVWQSMNLPQDKLDSLIASEVHARFTGDSG